MSRRPTIVRANAKPAVTPEQVAKFKESAESLIKDMMAMFINPITDMIENTESFMAPMEYTIYDEQTGEYVQKDGTMEDSMYHYARVYQESDPEGSYLNLPARLDQIISEFKVVKSELAKSSPGIDYEYVRRARGSVSPRPSSERVRSRSPSPSRAPVASVRSRSPSPSRAPVASVRSRSPSPSRASSSRAPRPSSPGRSRIPQDAQEIDIPEDFDLEVTPLN